LQQNTHISDVILSVVFNCNPSRTHAKCGQWWRKHNAAKSDAKGIDYSIRNERKAK